MLPALPRLLLGFQAAHVARRTTWTWSQPSGHVTQFVVRNSLSRSVVPLVLQHPSSLSWYACGPTVYDSAHVGHARTYVSQDVIRRILERFSISVTYVMGMTDIDDKIVQRAKERGLSWQALARSHEQEFLEDMRSLNVLAPSMITRVSDHIPEIVEFVRKIMGNGDAYVTEDGSVYFDTEHFRASHHYGKLQPLRHAHEAPESISTDRGKKHTKDFALWKAAPTTEPGWASPWGHGRPGWHIECSAMCGSVFGPHLGLHSGGIDLQFPHHDNEIAQCEAHFSTDSWCNYFLHTGHLHIEGHKMSKSLKNFTTIRDFLRGGNTARQFRVFCLLHKYHANVDFGAAQLQEAVAIERRLCEFHGNLSSALAAMPLAEWSARWPLEDVELFQTLKTKQAAIDKALTSDFDTPTAMFLLLDVIAQYYQDSGSRVLRPMLVLQTLSSLFHSVTSTFGLDYARPVPDEGRTRAVVQEFVDFRKEVRDIALSGGTPSKARLLQACDEVRDTRLPRCGVSLKDTKVDPTWHFTENDGPQKETTPK